MIDEINKSISYIQMYKMSEITQIKWIMGATISSAVGVLSGSEVKRIEREED